MALVGPGPGPGPYLVVVVCPLPREAITMSTQQKRCPKRTCRGYEAMCMRGQRLPIDLTI
jgi:hypothetical protein